MADGEDLDALVFDAIQDAVDAATLAVEKLADALAPKGGLRGQGAAVRKFGKAFDGVAKTIEPFWRRGSGEPLEIALSATPVQDAVRQSTSSSDRSVLLPPGGLRLLPLEPH